MGVTFLSTHSKMGSKKVVGPVTGLEYTISPTGTPVNDLDVPGLLTMTGPPCCGELPFGGQVKYFGKTAGSITQLAAVPQSVLNAGPKQAPRVEIEKKPEKAPALMVIEKETNKDLED